MKKRIPWLLMAAILTTGALTGCATQNPPAEQPNQEETNQDDEINQDDETNEDDETQLTDNREETIIIEGMEETITTFYYNGGKFKTYAPEDLLAESKVEGDVDDHWFYAYFQEQKNEEVYLRLFFYPETVTEAPDLTAADSLLNTSGLTGVLLEDTNKHYDWSLAEYKLEEGGYAYIGEYQGQYFAVVIRFTPEFEEGFGPRANLVLDNFFWSDTEDGLND